MAEAFTWLASYPKSGNTWLRLLLIAYRNNGMVDINQTGYIRSDTVPYYTNIVSPLPLTSLGSRMKLLLRPAALLHQLATSAEDPKFIKTHNGNLRSPETPPYIPIDLTTRAIFIVRDPRDVALSMANYMGHPIEQVVTNMASDEFGVGDITEIPSHTASWSMHTESWLDQKRFPILMVRYEDMMEDPAVELRRVLEFCSMDIDEARVEIAVKACELSRFRAQEAEHGFKENSSTCTKEFFGKGGSRWRDELEDDLVYQIETDHHSAMQRLGYLPADLLAVAT